MGRGWGERGISVTMRFVYLQKRMSKIIISHIIAALDLFEGIFLPPITKYTSWSKY